MISLSEALINCTPQPVAVVISTSILKLFTFTKSAPLKIITPGLAVVVAAVMVLPLPSKVTVLVALVSEIFVASVEVAAKSMGMTDAFVGFVVVALVGGAAEMASAFSAARKNRLDLSVGIALGSSAQIALFVAPVLVMASYLIGPGPMSLEFWPGAIVMMLFATLTASLVCNSGRSAWFTGVLVIAVYATFAVTLYLLPPK